MPVHLSSISKNDDHSKLIAFLMRNALADLDNAIASEDKRILHTTKYMRDVGSGERIGKFVFTLLVDQANKQFQVIDIDIMLDSKETAALRFLNKLPESSDANEYYDVEAVPGRQHLQIETVNRNYISKKALIGTVQKVHACAFPFRLSVYDDLTAFNKPFSWGKKKFGQKDLQVKGLSGTFAAPGSISQDPEFRGEVFSVLVGTINSFRDVTVNFGEENLFFTVAQAETALGMLPVAMSRDVFDLKKLAPGKIIYMYADVKADFAIDQ